MKSFIVLALALAACVLLAGCGGSSRSKPSLSSTSRSERLEAVRNAQNKYGAGKRPAPDPVIVTPVPAEGQGFIGGSGDIPVIGGGSVKGEKP
jgi:hypothetical protein